MGFGLRRFFPRRPKVSAQGCGVIGTFPFAVAIDANRPALVVEGGEIPALGAVFDNLTVLLELTGG
jgi:hypothetical protein